jgi:hypothetical protein
MNSRPFLIFRMLIEFAISLGCVATAIGVHISRHMWVDIVCRLLLAVIAIPIFTDAMTVRRDSLVY